MTIVREKILNKLEENKIYRIVRAIHDFIVMQLDYCIVFPRVLGFIMWPTCSILLFSLGKIVGGLLCAFLFATYWIHVLLFED